MLPNVLCTVRSGMPDAPRRVCSWYAVETFVRRATELVTRPYRKGHMRLLPISVLLRPSLHLSPLFPHKLAATYKDALFQHT